MAVERKNMREIDLDIILPKPRSLLAHEDVININEDVALEAHGETTTTEVGQSVNEEQAMEPKLEPGSK